MDSMISKFQLNFKVFNQFLLVSTGCPKKNCALFARLLWRSCIFNYLGVHAVA